MPGVFMLHRFEEWTPYTAVLSTPSFCCAVAEEWVLLAVVTAVAWASQSYLLWYGMVCGFAFHLVALHFALTIMFRRFVPGLVTAILFLPPCLGMLSVAAREL